MKVFNILFLLIFSIITILGQNDIKVPLNPKATYLKTHKNDNADPPIVINLEKYGLWEGDSIQLLITGDYCYSSSGSRKASSVIGVFSKSNYILSSSDLERVVDAIECGKDVISAPSHSGKLKTDIQQDFLIKNTTVLIPTDAKYLIIGIHDSHFRDNWKPQNFFLVIKKTSSTFRGTNVKYVDELTLESSKVKLLIWDNKIEDGDKISIFLNNKKIIDKHKVVKKKKKVKIKLNRGDNSLILFSENLGSVGKNTAALMIISKGIKKEIILNSDKGTSESIKLIF